jgi:hypothetical protein
MKFLYTVQYGAVPGNCSGNLHLFFSRLNSDDWQAAPAPGMWKPSGLTGTTTLPSGDAITFNLDLVANLPAQLYPQGTINVRTSAGKTFPPGVMGQATVNFVPGQAVMTVWSGRLQGAAGGVTWDVGFELPVPWDGTSADCHGQWWTIWYPA